MPVGQPPSGYNKSNPQGSYGQPDPAVTPIQRKRVALSTALGETATRNTVRLVVSLLLAGAAKYGVNLDEEAENTIFGAIMLILPVVLAVLQRWKQPLSTDAPGAGREDVKLEDGKSVLK